MGLSDEEWAELERRFSSESSTSATFKEPTARQRELAVKWQNTPPTDPGFRTYGTEAQAGRPIHRSWLPVGERRQQLLWVILAVSMTAVVVALWLQP